MDKSRANQILLQAQMSMLDGDFASAIRLLNQIIRKRSGMVEPWFMLGQIYGSSGQHEAASRAFARVITLNVLLPEAHFNQGLSLKSMGDTKAAIACFRRAASQNPDYVAAWYNLGASLLDTEQYEEAESAFLNVLRFDSSDSTYLALGIAAQGAGQDAKAMGYYLEALRRGNNSFTLHLNLGTVYYCQQDYENALRHSLAASSLNPDEANTLNNIGSCQLELGNIEGAMSHFKRSNNSRGQAGYLLAMNFLEAYDPDRIAAEHRTWGTRAVEGTPQLELPPRDLSPDRRLKIGYVSADLRQHPVSIFLERLLGLHDRAEFEVHCYSDVRKPDHVTARIRQSVDHWREIVRTEDAGVRDMIRRDRIDILVDLGGVTNERSLVFAARNAPVQVNYLGHVNTTGLATMDYRFTDELTDPPGQSDRFYTETLVRLGRTFFSFSPPEGSAEVGGLPALRNGYVTFASFNKRYKLNRTTIGLWSRAMTAIPDSRMIIVGRAVSSEHGKNDLTAMFGSFGIESGRLEFISYLPLHEYIALHKRIDLIMDCFPWNGHTTTMQALWMGVPTVTIEGKHHAGRFGYAIMTNIGLPEYIATSDFDFIHRVLDITRHLDSLSELRLGLRERLERSVLCNHRRLTQAVETSYRKMWTEWVACQRAAESA